MIEDQHDNMRSLIAPYSMGALPEEEIRFVRAHILECEECMAEADSYFEASSSLSLLIEDAELPAGFAGRLMGQLSFPAEARDVTARSTWWRVAAVVTIGALTVATAILGVIAFDARRVLQRNERILAALAEAPEGAQLRGDAGEVGRLIPTDEGSVLVLAGLAEAPQGKSYELWFLDGAPEPVSAAVFDVTGDLSVVETDLDFSDFSGAAISIEPEGGSPGPGPTGEIILQN